VPSPPDRRSRSLSAHDERLVEESEVTVFVQDRARGLEIVRAGDHLVEPPVVDPTNIHRGVPSGEKGGVG
jgi:hypothetical protein